MYPSDNAIIPSDLDMLAEEPDFIADLEIENLYHLRSAAQLREVSAAGRGENLEVRLSRKLSRC